MSPRDYIAENYTSRLFLFNWFAVLHICYEHNSGGNKLFHMLSFPVLYIHGILNDKEREREREKFNKFLS